MNSDQGFSFDEKDLYRLADGMTCQSLSVAMQLASEYMRAGLVNPHVNANEERELNQLVATTTRLAIEQVRFFTRLHKLVCTEDHDDQAISAH